jgi:hypothetical protein
MSNRAGLTYRHQPGTNLDFVRECLVDRAFVSNFHQLCPYFLGQFAGNADLTRNLADVP